MACRVQSWSTVDHTLPGELARGLRARASRETVDEEVEEQLGGLVPVLCGELIRDLPQVRVAVGREGPDIVAHGVRGVRPATERDADDVAVAEDPRPLARAISLIMTLRALSWPEASLFGVIVVVIVCFFICVVTWRVFKTGRAGMR